MRLTGVLVLAVCCVGCGGGDTSEVESTDAAVTAADANQVATTDEEPAETPPVDEAPESTDASTSHAADTDVTEKLQGKWVIVDANIGGASVGEMAGGTAEVTDNVIVVDSSGQKMKSTMVFQADTDPVQFESIAENGLKSPAILKFEGDELVVCASLTPGPHPETFEPGAGRMVIRYKRQE